MVVEERVEKVEEKKEGEKELCDFFLRGEGKVVVRDNGDFALSFEGTPCVCFVDEKGNLMFLVTISEFRF